MEFESYRHPEVEQLLNSCEHFAKSCEYLYFDNNRLFAQVIWDYPYVGYDFESEVNIYLRNGGVIQILFGTLEPELIWDIVSTYCIRAPHAIKTLTWSQDETTLPLIIDGALAGHC